MTTDTLVSEASPTPARTGLLARLLGLLGSRYLLSVGAQALVSAFHFAINLLLLQLLTPFDYGTFAFAFVLAMFAQAINNALISTPLTVYTPVLADETERHAQESMFATYNLLLFVLLVAGGAFAAQFSEFAGSVGIGVAVFVAVYSARHFSRSFGYARLRPLVTACGDITYVVSGVAIIALLLWSGRELSVTDCLLTLSAANVLAILVEQLSLHGTGIGVLFRTRITGYATVWLQSRWALVGALTTLFMSQAHSLVITWSHGPDAFAPLAAGFVLFGPVRVALLTWQNMVKPELAMNLAKHRTGQVRRQIRSTSLLMAGAVVLLAGALWLAWPWIHAYLYSERYADRPMGFIVAMWSAITLFAAAYNAPSAALQALRDFRSLAWSSMYGALISGVLVALILWQMGPSQTLFGILAAEAFMCVYLALLVHRQLARVQAEAPAA